MVKGFELFKRQFAPFSDNYIIIGGCACDWLFSQRDVRFRSTKDIDLVICAETLTPAFVAAFWDFIRAGDYTAYERKDGKRCFYRFQNPTRDTYPSMLELFARAPLAYPLIAPAHITPIPVEDPTVSSLSGILLDENYYAFIQRFRQKTDGVCVLSPEAIILLKARAWIDLSARKARGEFVKEKDLTKHKNDIFRLLTLLGATAPIPLPTPLYDDFQLYLTELQKLAPDPRDLGLPITFSEALSRLTALFSLQ